MPVNEKNRIVKTFKKKKFKKKMNHLKKNKCSFSYSVQIRLRAITREANILTCCVLFIDHTSVNTLVCII